VMGTKRLRVLPTVLVCVVVSIGVLELGARLLADDTRWNAGFQRYAEVARAQGFPEAQLRKQLEMYAEADHALKYYDYFLYSAAPGKLPAAEFTDLFSARKTPASVADTDARHFIWMFGGSTMQNMETSDELTIANTVAEVLRNND